MSARSPYVGPPHPARIGNLFQLIQLPPDATLQRSATGATLALEPDGDSAVRAAHKPVVIHGGRKREIELQHEAVEHRPGNLVS
jgi:hypothetical protein